MRHVLIALLVLLAGCAGGPPFDAQRWRDADLSTRERVGMADTLIRTHRLDGLDRTAVVAPLGDPTPTEA